MQVEEMFCKIFHTLFDCTQRKCSCSSIFQKEFITFQKVLLKIKSDQAFVSEAFFITEIVTSVHHVRFHNVRVMCVDVTGDSTLLGVFPKKPFNPVSTSELTIFLLRSVLKFGDKKCESYGYLLTGMGSTCIF